MSDSLKDSHVLLREIAKLKQRISELECRDEELQENLEEAEELGEAVIECSPIPLFVVSFDGRLMRWNPPLEELTGYSTEQLTTTPGNQLFDDGEAFQDLVEEAGSAGRSEGIVQVVTSHSVRMTFDANFERIHCHGNFCMVCVLFDARQKERSDRITRAGAVSRAKVAMLSRRQKEVFDLVVSGMANKNIAAQLGISEKTVEVHRSQVMRKMDVLNLASLVRLAVLAELVNENVESN